MPHSILCLGDSYTIGEGVPTAENFPSQTVQLLRARGLNFEEAEILAKTGWTTDELQAAVNRHQFHPSYDFVTLLIGVNNQYRGRALSEYGPEFEALLKLAIQLAKNDARRVIVLSIPDWGVTPFAKSQSSNATSISAEIDAFNQRNKAVSDQYHVNYLEITTATRQDTTLLAPDGLHPSGKEYARWAASLANLIESLLNQR